jgi:mono/diheme cytochrome c family protein
MGRRQRHLWVGLVLAVIVALLSACGDGDGGDSAAPRPTGVQADDPALVRGRAVFVANCARCHGSAAEGGIGPKLADGRIVDRYPDIADPIAVVTNGRGSMPSFQSALSPAEIRAVVRYLREVT